MSDINAVNENEVPGSQIDNDSNNELLSRINENNFKHKNVRNEPEPTNTIHEFDKKYAKVKYANKCQFFHSYVFPTGPMGFGIPVIFEILMKLKNFLEIHQTLMK